MSWNDLTCKKRAKTRKAKTMVMVMVICSALVRSHLIYLAVGSFGPVPSRVDSSID